MKTNIRRNGKTAIGLFCLVLSALFASCSSSADDTDPMKVCRAALQQLYPEAQDVDWEQKDGYYVADFDYPPLRLEMEVWFQPDGQWVMKEYDYEEDMTPVPLHLIETLGKHYPEARILEVHKYEHVKGSYFWYVKYRMPDGNKGCIAGTASARVYGDIGTGDITPNSPAWGTGQPNVHP